MVSNFICSESINTLDIVCMCACACMHVRGWVCLRACVCALEGVCIDGLMHACMNE